ncbi:MAG: hypothetical protein ABJA10_10725 [Aestuariivirga sp.]
MSRSESYAHTIRKALTRTTARESNTNARHKRCTVFGCTNETQAFAGKGLSQTFCTSHVRHLARHGTAHRGSYRAAELKPYLWAAHRWLKENKANSLVTRIEFAFEAMMDGAGKPEIATRMIRADAKRKAKNMLAVMRVRGVKPNRLMGIVLATHAILRDDQSFSHRGTEFLRVQAARQAHRLAARFTPAGMEGKKSAPGVKLKWGHESFPYSAGLAMRELGRLLDEIGGHLADRALNPILELKAQRFGHHASRPAFEDVRLSANV